MTQSESMMLIGLFFFVLLSSIQQVVPVALPAAILIFCYLIFVFNNKPKPSYKEIITPIILISIYLIMLLISAMTSTEAIEYLQIRRISFGIISFIIVGMVISSGNSVLSEKLHKCFLFVIVFHALVVGGQYILFHSTGIEYDVLNLLGRAANSKLGINEQVFYRPAGFFLEPGTYATQCFMLFVCYSILRKPSWIFTLLVALTYASTMSVFALIFALIVVTYRYTLSKKFNFLFLMFFFIFNLLIIYFFLGDYIIVRFLERDDQSLGVKMQAVDYFLNWPYEKYFYGNGLANTEGLLVRDSTLFFNYIFFGGVFGLALIVWYMIIFLRKDKYLGLLYFGIFISKVDYIYINFWLMTALLCFDVKKRCRF